MSPLVHTLAGAHLPPGRAFISHSYLDTSAVKKLTQMLPPEVTPDLFPKVDSDPRQAVSDGIVQKIRTADSLIYLTGGASEDSAWVNFERDFALRSGLPVFLFRPEGSAVARDDGRPVDLTPEFIVSEDGFERAVQLMRWLTDERSFSFTQQPTVLRMKEIPSQILWLLERGAPMVWVVDSFISGVVGLAYTLDEEGLEQFDDDYPRSLENWQLWLQNNSIFVRISQNWKPTTLDDGEERYVLYEIDPVERAFGLGYGIDLTTGVEEAEINWNGADDLVVKLTMLAQRTRPFFLPDNERGDQ